MKQYQKKKEFYINRIENRNKDIYCLEPQQRFLSNYINPLTYYNSILIYHSVGVGKTLSAISIAENFKNNYTILVLIKNKNLELNFRKELLGICSNYLTKDERKIYNSSSEEGEALKTRINKEINKKYTFMTYGSLVNDVLGRKNKGLFKDDDKLSRKKNLKDMNINNTVLIIDEVHNITGNDAYKAVMKLINNSKNFKTILLSATPVYDNVKEIFEICNLLGDNLPTGEKLVKENFVTYSNKINSNTLLKNTVNTLTTKGKNIIINSLRGKVSYLVTDPKLFPKRINKGSPITQNQGSINIYKCNISSFQEDIYETTFNGIKNVDAVKDLSPLITDNTNVLFKDSSNALTIVYPDGSYGKEGFIKNIINNKDKSFLKKENIKKYSCKLYNILVNIEEAQGPCFIYSNFVNFGGTSLIREMLIVNGYSKYGSSSNKPKFLLLDDSVKPIKRQRILRTFNNNDNAYGKDIKIIIGSPVVSEGITFKNIRQIHILEPYWNLSRIEQIIGRGVRLNSHKALPENQRIVEIFLHTSMTSNTPSIDYLKYQMSDKKDRVIKEVEYIIKKNSVDCSLNKSRNKLPSTLNNSRECQYTSCDYTCPSENKIISIDNSTYDLITHDKAKYNFILENIKNLYKIGHIYDLPHIINYINNNSKTAKISKKNIYYVLDDIIKAPIIITNPLGYKCNLIALDNVYIANPEDNPISESFFNKLYKIISESKKLDQVIKTSHDKITNRKKRKSIVKIDPKILEEPIYGSYIDKQGNKDNKFRIIDNRDISSKRTDKRKLTTGKVCSTYSKPQLKNILTLLKLKNTHTLNSKEELCDYIEKYLISHKKIIK